MSTHLHPTFEPLDTYRETDRETEREADRERERKRERERGSSHFGSNHFGSRSRLKTGSSDLVACRRAAGGHWTLSLTASLVCPLSTVAVPLPIIEDSERLIEFVPGA